MTRIGPSFRLLRPPEPADTRRPLEPLSELLRRLPQLFSDHPHASLHEKNFLFLFRSCRACLHGIECLDRVVEFLGPLGEDQSGVENRLAAKVLRRWLVEWAENKGVCEELLDQLLGPVRRISDVGDRT